MSTWCLTVVAKTSDCDKVHQPLQVRMELRVPTPQLASQSVLKRAPGQAPGNCLAPFVAPT